MRSQKLRYVLSRLECALRDRFDEDVTVATENLTVEHVMPNRWAAHWPLPSGISVPDENPYNLPPVSEEVWAEVEEREALKHTLGNLTLLTSSLNPSLGNSGWPEKRVAIFKSLLVLNRNIARQVGRTGHPGPGGKPSGNRERDLVTPDRRGSATLDQRVGLRILIRNAHCQA